MPNNDVITVIPGFVETGQTVQMYKCERQTKGAHEHHGLLKLDFRNVLFQKVKRQAAYISETPALPLTSSLEPADRFSRNIDFIHLKVTPKAGRFISHQSLITTWRKLKHVRSYRH